jgi:hypothetical protein
LGFQSLKSDACIYEKGNEGNMIIVGIHVDDAKFVAQNDKVEEEFAK